MTAYLNDQEWQVRFFSRFRDCLEHTHARQLQRLLMDALMGGGDEALEHWVRLMGFAVEFRVKLARDEERMFWQFDDFDEFAVRRIAAEGETRFLEFFAVSVVEFVTVAVAFVHDEGTVE